LAPTFQGEHSAERGVAVLDEHPGFPLLAILWLTLRGAMSPRSMSPEREPKDQNDNGVKQTLWAGSDARENHATLYMNFLYISV
jgi:hypothetical protein